MTNITIEHFLHEYKHSDLKMYEYLKNYRKHISSIQEEIDGLELLLSVYDESDSKYIDIEETINGLAELQEIYKVEPITYAPKIVTDGETYSYLTPPSEKYKAKELASFYKVIEDSVEAKRNKRFNTKELKTRLDLIDFDFQVKPPSFE